MRIMIWSGKRYLKRRRPLDIYLRASAKVRPTSGERRPNQDKSTSCKMNDTNGAGDLFDRWCTVKRARLLSRREEVGIKKKLKISRSLSLALWKGFAAAYIVVAWMDLTNCLFGLIYLFSAPFSCNKVPAVSLKVSMGQRSYFLAPSQLGYYDYFLRKRGFLKMPKQSNESIAGWTNKRSYCRDR